MATIASVFYKKMTEEQILSESRESNSDRVLPKHVYYHYTTLRLVSAAAASRPIRVNLCRERESNPRRHPLQGCALPLSYHGMKSG